MICICKKSLYVHFMILNSIVYMNNSICIFISSHVINLAQNKSSVENINITRGFGLWRGLEVIECCTVLWNIPVITSYSAEVNKGYCHLNLIQSHLLQVIYRHTVRAKMNLQYRNSVCSFLSNACLLPLVIDKLSHCKWIYSTIQQRVNMF